MGRTTSLFLVLLVLGEALCDGELPRVTIAQGTLVGQKITPDNNLAPYYSFLGIPYAKPPVGDLRFKAPVPDEPWKGLLAAWDEGHICTQPNTTNTSSIIGDEDCLYLNIYTPELPGNGEPRAVMVWIHGGGFTTGSGSSYRQGPEYLVNSGIVYVGFNYRLGIFGFFSTQDAAAPGNAGLKDQVLALRWVKENIAAFGGDPEKVTIFGESAGALSVHYHLVSPITSGLFRSAIADSGSAASSLAVDGKARNESFIVGQILGFSGESSNDLVDFLRNVSTEELITASYQIVLPEDQYRLLASHQGPVLEAAVEGEEAFLTENPITLLEAGKFHKVPFLTGLNLAEGIIMSQANLTEIDQNFAKFFKPELRYCTEEPCGDEMAAKIKEFYFGDEPVSADTLQNFIDLCTDVFFAEGTLHEVKTMANQSSQPVYFYNFIYNGALAYVNMSPPNISGPGHADELGYLFDFGVNVPDDSEAAKVRSRMVKLWTDFVKTGNPSPNVTDEIPAWLPFTSDSKDFLEIGAQLMAKTDYHKKRMDFWADLYSSQE